MTFKSATLRPANTPGAFILDNQGDEQLLFAEDVERLYHLFGSVLAPHVHNTDESDPDAHVVFPSVCCGAKLYRCSATQAGLPCKPIIHQGESNCRDCGATLAQF